MPGHRLVALIQEFTEAESKSRFSQPLVKYQNEGMREIIDTSHYAPAHRRGIFSRLAEDEQSRYEWFPYSYIQDSRHPWAQDIGKETIPPELERGSSFLMEGRQIEPQLITCH